MLKINIVIASGQRLFFSKYFRHHFSIIDVCLPVEVKDFLLQEVGKYSPFDFFRNFVSMRAVLWLSFYYSNRNLILLWYWAPTSSVFGLYFLLYTLYASLFKCQLWVKYRIFYIKIWIVTYFYACRLFWWVLLVNFQVLKRSPECGGKQILIFKIFSEMMNFWISRILKLKNCVW